MEEGDSVTLLPLEKGVGGMRPRPAASPRHASAGQFSPFSPWSV